MANVTSGIPMILGVKVLHYILFTAQNNSLGNIITSLHNDITVMCLLVSHYIMAT